MAQQDPRAASPGKGNEGLVGRRDSRQPLRETSLAWDVFGLPELDPVLDAELQLQVERAVRGYERKLEGKEPWIDFAAMVPDSARRQP